MKLLLTDPLARTIASLFVLTLLARAVLVMRIRSRHEALWAEIGRPRWISSGERGRARESDFLVSLSRVRETHDHVAFFFAIAYRTLVIAFFLMVFVPPLLPP